MIFFGTKLIFFCTKLNFFGTKLKIFGTKWNFFGTKLNFFSCTYEPLYHPAFKSSRLAEAYLKPHRTSRMELFCKNSWRLKLLTAFTQETTSHMFMDSKYASGLLKNWLHCSEDLGCIITGFIWDKFGSLSKPVPLSTSIFWYSFVVPFNNECHVITIHHFYLKLGNSRWYWKFRQFDLIAICGAFNGFVRTFVIIVIFPIYFLKFNCFDRKSIMTSFFIILSQDMMDIFYWKCLS